MFNAYKRFFAFAGKQKKTWYKGMGYELLRSIFEAIQFIALLVVLRALVEQNVTGETALAALGVMLVSVTGAAVFWYLAHNSEGQANYHMCEEKRIRIGERMKYMPMGYFNSQSLGSLTAAATSTMEDLESMSFAVIARTMVGIIRTVVFSIAILFFDWRIGLIFLLGVLLFLFVNSQLLKKSRQLSPGRLQAQTKLVDSVLEYIQGMSVVRAFHGDKAANQTLNKTIEETEYQNFKLERKRIPYNVLEQIVLRIAAVAAVLLSIWLYLSGAMTLFTCLMMAISAFLVYSELESAGEMFFIHRPAADIHEQNRRFVLDKFRMDGDGGIPLWEQFHILDGYFVGDSLKFEAHRLGRMQKVFPEGLFLTAKSGQRQPCCEVYGTLSLFSALFNLFGDSGKGKQVVVVVLHLVPQDGLPARPAHEKLPAVLQRVLQGVGFMAVNSDTGWERKMPGFDGVIAVVYADVHGFAHPFLTVVENLRALFGGLEYACWKEMLVLSQLVSN